jgi:hypothetical protein
MPFDGKVSDYFETKPAPVYDRDSPPPTMAEAIRMAVADVEALLDRGFQYGWGHPWFLPEGKAQKNHKACVTCTAGAVVARMTNYKEAVSGLSYDDVSVEWRQVLRALSDLTLPGSTTGVSDAYGYWPQGFTTKPPRKSVGITPANKDPAAFKRDMLALADRLEAEAV